MGMIQGSGIDSSLNNTGLMQAELFHKAYSDLEFDSIYVSALKRTHESVGPFTESGIPTEYHPELNEISWGNHEGKIANSLNKEYFHSIINEWKTGNTHVTVSGGESPDELAERHRKIIELVYSRNDDRILICMHGRALRIFLCTILEIPLTEMDRFAHENLCLYILQLNADGKFELVAENDTEHLKELELVKA